MSPKAQGQPSPQGPLTAGWPWPTVLVLPNVGPEVSQALLGKQKPERTHLPRATQQVKGGTSPAQQL